MKKIFACMLAAFTAFALFGIVGCSSSSSESEDEAQLYNNAEIVEIKSGDGSRTVGEYSLITMPEAEVTDEVIVDWYLNYVKDHDYNWCMILYSDHEPFGVYAISGDVEKGVEFAQENNGEYYVGNSEDAIRYVIDDDGTIVQP